MKPACDTGLSAHWRPSPNFQPRRNGRVPTLLLLHYTGMETAQAALDILTRADSGVSCHYLVDEQGQITQMVAESERAWHAGEAFWGGIGDVNSASIGIEIVNPGHALGYRDFPARQIAAVMALCRDILSRHAIAPRNVLAHSDVAPHRKQDPGEKFPWKRLHESGIGHYVAPVAIGPDTGFYVGDENETIAAARRLLAQYGYRVAGKGAFGRDDADLVTAFQRHFRPERVDGRLDVSTFETLKRLLGALPVVSVSDRGKATYES